MGFVSANTIFIMEFHGFSNRIVMPLIDAMAAGPPLVRQAIAAVLSIALLVPLNLLVLRFVPELVGLVRHPATHLARADQQ